MRAELVTVRRYTEEDREVSCKKERLECKIGLSKKRKGKIFSQKEGLEKNPEAAHGGLLSSVSGLR